MFKWPTQGHAAGEWGEPRIKLIAPEGKSKFLSPRSTLPSGAMSLILGSPHSPAAWPWVGHLNILNLSFTNYKMGLQDLSHLPANVARTFRWANECGWVLYTQKKNSSYYLLSTYYVLGAYLGSFFTQGVQLNIQPQTTTGARGRSISSDSIMK